MGRAAFRILDSVLRPKLVYRRSLAAFGWVIVSLPAAFATDVLVWHNDLARTGQNLNETVLTPANVNFNQFGKLFLIPVDGQVYAQPLYVSNLSIPGNGTHNVVYIATEHDSVYACDADNGAVLWQVSVLKAGETPSDDRGCDQITPEIGITATPVIDRNAGPNGTIYVAPMSKDASENYFQRLHALDLVTGMERPGSPIDVSATYPGSGANSSGGNVIFDPKQYKERPGLVLSNGIVYTTWSSHCDINPYTSFVIGYNQTSLVQARVIDLVPNGSQGSIWAAGAAPAVDASGNLYALTGNGTFETTLDANGFPNKADFGNCFVKISTANNTLQVADYWTMFNTVAESNADQDLGSGGAVLLPDMTDSGGVTRHLAVGAGKDGHIYMVDRDNMGKFNPNSNASIYQDLPGATANGEYGTPAYFNNTLYIGGTADNLKAFPVSSARLATSPSSSSTVTFSYPGTTPSVSANGTANAIVWAAATGSGGVAILRAFDAGNLGTELYNSTQAANNRDQFGNAVKFVAPTIANGKVYVGAAAGVAVFGLQSLPTPTPTATATPTATPTPTPTPTATPTATPTPTPGSGPAVMISPAPGTTFTGSTVTFQWTAGGATQYALTLGSSPRALDIYSSGQTSALSATATNLPTDGRTVYATLYSKVNNTWVNNTYTYTASKPVILNSAMSSALHGTSPNFVGTFGINLPLSGPAGIECRSTDGVGGDGSHTVKFSFANSISSVDNASTSCGSIVSQGVESTPNTNVYDVRFNGGSCNQQRVTVTLTGVHDVSGQTLASTSATVGLLLGDVNGNGLVDGNDVAAVQGQVRQAVTNANFQFDVNANGIIDGNDVSLTQAHVRTALPSTRTQHQFR